MDHKIGMSFEFFELMPIIILKYFNSTPVCLKEQGCIPLFYNRCLYKVDSSFVKSSISDKSFSSE